MPVYHPSDKPTNKYHIMKCIECEGPINRAAIAKKVHLSIPAVMTITNDLMERNLIEVVGKATGNAGKQPEMLGVVPGCEYRVGVDIGRGTVRIVMVNRLNQIICKTQQASGEVQDAEAFVNRLCLLVNELIDSSGVNKAYISGVGVAMPGLIEQDTGHVVFSPDFSWSDIPLQDWLVERLPFPVIVENANRALALSEADWGRFSIRPSAATLLCVNIGHGIGGAILQNSMLYYGSSGTSGEIGHITVNKEGLLCACGNTGCLEAMASGDAIARQAKDALARGLSSLVDDMCGHDRSKIDAKMVFEAAKAGDDVALSLVDKATDYIGIALAMMVNILDPGKIVLCGGLTRNGDFFFERVLNSLQRRQMKRSGRNVTVSVSVKGEFSTALGATSVVEYNGWRIPMLKHFY